LMVGGAVRAGSGNRGGLFYQLLALFLCYSAISAMHVPYIIEGMSQEAEKDEEAEVAVAEKDAEKSVKVEPKPAPDAGKEPAKAKDAAAAKTAAGAQGKGQPVQIAEVKIKVGQGAHGQEAEARRLTLVTLLIVLAVTIALVYASPVLVATQAPLSGLIYGFALWEAWRMNRKAQLVFNGPFRVGAQGASAPTPEGTGDGG
jgi:hypothetical protein